MDSTAVETTVRSVLADQGKLSDDAHSIAVDADLYRAGMTSHASVNVMLGLEDEFDIEFPEERLTKATFTSVQSITEAVEAIRND
ncbi:acyl carrier protein [Kocuria tytonicola]|uniref:Acyl carrier protein n=1 Tax=Kocuria tytonicola TaxID=2055946 RepID=A0A3L9L0C8_9MICC|nr:acyl carrier protein [Kocuria tytonicola]RLY91588.1 acyl carrier protein [Kocuria tytonicola]